MYLTRFPSGSRVPDAMPRTMLIAAASGTGKSSIMPARASCVSSASHAASPAARDGLLVSPAIARGSRSAVHTQRMPRLYAISPSIDRRPSSARASRGPLSPMVLDCFQAQRDDANVSNLARLGPTR